MKDLELVKKQHLQEQLGVFDSDLPNIGEKLIPRLPRVLEKLQFDEHHFGGNNYTPESKLSFLASCAALASSQSRLDDVGRTGSWSTNGV